MNPTGPDQNGGYLGRDRQYGTVSLEDSPATPVETTGAITSNPVYQPQAPKTLLRFNKVALIVTSSALVLVLIAGLFVLSRAGFKANDQELKASQQSADGFGVSNVNASGLNQDQLLTVTQASKLQINGELQVGDTFVLTPTATPSIPKVGQMYFDKSTNTPYVYNGSAFVSLIDGPRVESFGGATGSIALGNGLQMVNGQLVLSNEVQQSLGAKVSSLQGQSGDVNLTGGAGISINGTTISSTGLLDITGANGIQVSRTGGTAVLTLPQALGITSTPTFASLQLSNALGLNAGGTNATGASYTNGGIFYFNGTSFTTTGAPAANGLCFLSGPTGPYFGSCSGAAAGVVSLNGANGVLILDNAVANTTTGHITMQDASNSQKGIAQFTASDFGTTGGVVSLNTNVTKAGNTFNASNSLIRLDTNGQSTATGQCLLSTATGTAFAPCPIGGNISSGTSQTAGRLTKFDTTTNRVTDSIASESGTTITVGGTLLASSLQGSGAAITNLNASNITTGTLSVARGGTGQVSFATNSILLGNGTAGLGSLAPGANGQCLVIVGGAPTFTTCTGAGGVSSVNTGTGALTIQGANGVSVSSATGGIITITGPTIATGVTSLNGLSGALTVADASASGSTVTINTATTNGQKGIASYDAANFSVSGAGVVTTIQGIGTSAAPTFGGLSLQGSTAALSGTGAGGTTRLQFATQTGNDTKTITIPNTTGTFAVNATGPLSLSATGVLSCATCLTSGGGGAGGVSSVNGITGAVELEGNNGITIGISGTKITISGSTPPTGVSSLNGATGALTVANASISSGTITINDASNSQKGIASFDNGFSVAGGVVSLGNTVTRQGNTFNGVNQLLQLDAAGFIPALNASQLLSLNADSVTSGTLSVARGGTGAGSFTLNGVIYGNGTSLGSTTAGTNGQCLISNGSGAAPSFQTCTGAGGVSSVNTLTGNVTIAGGTGIDLSTLGNNITIANGGVTQLQGTNNQVTVSGSTGSVTISLPQNIHTGAAVQFGSAALTGASALTLGQSNSTTGAIVFKNSSNNFATTLQSANPSGDITFTLPSSAGSANQCLITNGSGVLSFGNCLSGSGGGSNGVASLNGLSGALTLSNSTTSGSTIILDTATSSVKGIASFTSDFSVVSGAVSLATVSATKGGTGLTSYTAGDLLYASSSTAIGRLNAVAVGSCLISKGVGIAPDWGSCGDGGLAIAPGSGQVNGRITKFVDGQLADTGLSESGSTLSYAGNMNLSSGSQYQINGSQISSANLSNDSNLAKLNANQSFTGSNSFATDNTAALRIQNSSSNVLLNADTTNMRLSVGSAAGSDASLHVEGEPSTAWAGWTPRTAAEFNRWSDVVYGNGLFVAVANTGTNRVMTSPDGITWTARTGVETNSWTSIAYGNGLFVAVSADGTNRVMTSSDGITWTARTAAEANGWNSITYGNGLFVAAAGNGTNRVMTSPDGITWTARTTPVATWQAVTYGGGTFVAIDLDGTPMTSSDGITWTARTAPAGNNWVSITYGNGLFVAGGFNGGIMTSPDGITWTTRTTPTFLTLYGITYGNGLFVATGWGSGVNAITSPDGVTWTARATGESSNWSSVAYGNGLFVATAVNGTNRVMSAPTYGGKPALRVNGGAEFNGNIRLGQTVVSANSPTAFLVQDTAGITLLSVNTNNFSISLATNTAITGTLTVTGATSVTGTLKSTGNLITNSGLYTGSGSGTLRLAADGTLQNVKLDTNGGTLSVNNTGGLPGALVTNSSGTVSLATTNSASLCLVSNGPSGAPSFQTCPSGPATVSVSDSGLNGALMWTPQSNGWGTYTLQLSAGTGYTAVSGDFLEYDVWCASGSDCNVGVTNGDAQLGVDQNGKANSTPDMNNISQADIGSYASGKWYHRKVALTAGTNMSNIYLRWAIQGAGGRTFYFKGIGITNGTTVQLRIYDGTKPTGTFALGGTGSRPCITSCGGGIEELRWASYDSLDVTNTSVFRGKLYVGCGSGVNKCVSTASAGGGSSQTAATYLMNNNTGASLGVVGNAYATGTFTTNASPDIAETIDAAPDVAVGDLVVPDPTHPERAIKSNKAYDTSVLGAISDGTGGFLINAYGNQREYEEGSDGYTGKPLVIGGRIKVKVSTENGVIRIGDPITTSNIPGYGMKATKAGNIVGYALDNLDDTGMVLVYLNLTYYAPSDSDLLQSQSAEFGGLNVSGSATIHDLTVTGLATVHNISVSGHIITAGGQPTSEAQALAGAGAMVSVSGTDTTGTITITTGDAPASGDMAKLIFSELYTQAPRVVLSPSDEAAAGAEYFKGATTTESFVLNFKSAPQPHTVYSFDYFIAQ